MESIQTRPAKINRPFDPSLWFADRTVASRIWFYLFLIATGINLLQGPIWYSLLHEDSYVTVLDQAGTFHRSPLLAFSRSEDIIRYCAQLATIGLFNRNPSGADFPEILSEAYLPVAGKSAVNYINQTQNIFSTKSLYQKPSITDYKIINHDTESATVIVSGQLIAQGTVDGTAFTPQPDDFTLLLFLARNPDMTRNGRLPMAVFHFELKINGETVPISDTPKATTASNP